MSQKANQVSMLMNIAHIFLICWRMEPIVIIKNWTDFLAVSSEVYQGLDLLTSETVTWISWDLNWRTHAIFCICEKLGMLEFLATATFQRETGDRENISHHCDLLCWMNHCSWPNLPAVPLHWCTTHEKQQSWVFQMSLWLASAIRKVC